MGGQGALEGGRRGELCEALLARRLPLRRRHVGCHVPVVVVGIWRRPGAEQLRRAAARLTGGVQRGPAAPVRERRDQAVERGSGGLLRIRGLQLCR